MGESASDEYPGDALPPLLVTMVEDALVHWDFVAARRSLTASGLGRARLQPLHRLAHAGQLLLDLDLEDLDAPPAVVPPLREALQRVCLPQRPGSEPRGLLGSLRPTAALLLEVTDVRHAQSDIDALLAAVHLLGEALPLLAWEPVLGHGGDPVQLQQLVLREGSLWGSAACPSSGPAARAARGLRGATRSDTAWQDYLERAWSNLGVQLDGCARCPVRCSVAAPGDTALRARLDVARAFRRSDIVGARHGSTVGHAFAIPGRDEVDRVWRKTRQRLARQLPAVLEDDGHRLPGLRRLVEEVAGVPLRDVPLLARVRSELLARLRDGG